MICGGFFKTNNQIKYKKNKEYKENIDKNSKL